MACGRLVAVDAFVGPTALLRRNRHYWMLVRATTDDNHVTTTNSNVIPTPRQQEQLGKYGATPETSLEILLDHLIMTRHEHDETLVGGVDPNPEAREHWEKFIDNMKQLKQRREDGFQSQ